MTADVRQTTAATLITRIREMADMETGDLVVGDSFVTDAELLRHIDASYTRLWGLMAAKDPVFAEAETQLGMDGSNRDWALPADFMGIIAVDWQKNGRWIELPRYTLRERNLVESNVDRVGDPLAWRLVGNSRALITEVVALRILPTPTSGITVRVMYTKHCPTIDETTDVVYGWNGWDQWIVLDVAIKIRSKEESSTDKLERQQARIFDEITAETELLDMEPVRMIATSAYSEGYDHDYDPAFRWPVGGA